MNFRKLEKEDWEQVSEIYRQGIETKNVTFQLDIPNWIDWDNGHL
ncbi:MAG: L-amino acid N-acyltransferase YncA [Bacteroidia bacterium]|jgi:L-amino acid N-acyltransferase YncA